MDMYVTSKFYQYEHSRDLDPLLLTWKSNHMPSKVWDWIIYPFPNFKDIFGFNFRTRYLDSIFRRDTQTRYSDAIVGHDIRTDSQTRYSDSIFRLEFWTQINYFIPHIIMDVITGLPQSSQKIFPWLFPNCQHKSHSLEQHMPSIDKIYSYPHQNQLICWIVDTSK